MGRALSHALGDVRGGSDPLAIELVPEECRVVVERVLARKWPRTHQEAALTVAARFCRNLMGPRTAEIDDGVASSKSKPQLVIVGAGLDARAHRMKELADTVVFEVDHPASQAFKRERAKAFIPLARELRYAAADLSVESLVDALVTAGHDANRATVWIFEGVITYLTPQQVEGAIVSMASRSAPKSRLIATYNEPSWTRRLAAGATARVGEPQRAAYAIEDLHSLLRKHDWAITSDRDGVERALRWKGSVSLLDHVWPRFHHVVIADRQ
jgi:methyltransferase (TIGR00027 family)